MNKNYIGSFLLAEDAAPGTLFDFLCAPYRGGYKSAKKENVIYMNRKQRIADAVAAEMMPQKHVACAE